MAEGRPVRPLRLAPPTAPYPGKQRPPLVSGGTAPGEQTVRFQCLFSKTNSRGSTCSSDASANIPPRPPLILHQIPALLSSLQSCRPLIKSGSSSLQRSPCRRTRRSPGEKERGMGAQEETEDGASSAGTKREKREKTSKDVHFCILPDKYEPLIEEDGEEKELIEEERIRRKEDKRQKRRKKYKRYRKNVWKALRYSCSCLLAGLQNMVSPYATPLSAMSTVVTEVHRYARPDGT
ncbi:required for drug-induced death protein 1-like [Cololabis saira]|uniref:required for drug-induced death protein 1-like n=1 Tax=Cololabis saira TaxID=129043 RepID=UPI002AD2E520|nr:required for drug-induced death protein 1-like [Cololabis saira]